MPKPAYMIFRMDIHDAKTMDEYVAGGTTSVDYGMSVVTATTQIELLDGVLPPYN